MLRALLAALLLANVLFFGWAHGWFEPVWHAPRHGEREPERLAAQVRPQMVEVLPARAASAALSAARAAARMCLQAGPFDDKAGDAAEAVLAAASLPTGTWSREAVAPAQPWLVYAGRFAEGAARRARQEELTRLGLSFEPLTSPPELAPGLVISRHADRPSAEAALAQVSTSTALRGAKVVELPASATQTWLRVPRANAELAERLRVLPADALGGGFVPCPPTGAAPAAGPSASLAAPS